MLGEVFLALCWLVAGWSARLLYETWRTWPRARRKDLLVMAKRYGVPVRPGETRRSLYLRLRRHLGAR